jgi:hypothetical protein
MPVSPKTLDAPLLSNASATAFSAASASFRDENGPTFIRSRRSLIPNLCGFPRRQQASGLVLVETFFGVWAV